MTKSLAILGAGCVGRTLGRGLHEIGWRITVVAARSEANAKRAVRFIGDGQPALGIPATLAASAVILFTVPDDVIAHVAAELAGKAQQELRGKVALHTSGALNASVLEPLLQCGAAVGSMHAMQTFNGVSMLPLVGKVFAIEGDESAVRMARSIARSLGGVPVGVCASKKPLYHAAGLCLALEEAGVRILMDAGLKRREAERALLSLTRQVLDNYEKLGPQKEWTGPLSGGDFGMVASHEQALRQAQPEFLVAYRAVSRLSAQVLSHDSAAMVRKLDAIAASGQIATDSKGGYE